MSLRLLLVTCLALCLGSSLCLAAATSVLESARKIPVAYEVDVVVVGGSTHGVAAAAAAAKGGAKVFLAAPRHYLGEDMCATLRLWIDAGAEPDTPLGKKLFAARIDGPAVRKGAAFTYETSIPSAAKHRDTRPPSRLGDGRYHDAPRESVQYDGDVTITADLGAPKTLTKVHVLCYQRPADFEVKDISVATSTDKKDWTDAGTAANRQLDAGGAETWCIDVSLPVTHKARYVRLQVAKTDRCSRVLLGEVVIETAEDAAPARPAPKPPVPRVTTPMQVKATLDEALLGAGVRFLYGCYVTGVLRDADGRCAGIVMANRAGRQAVRAKVVIDATDRAVAARLAGAEAAPYPTGKHTFSQIVIGGEVAEGAGLTGRKIGQAFPIVARSRDGRTGRATGRGAEIIEYTVELPMKDAGYASFAAAEQTARDLTWNREALRVSEGLFEVPPDAVKGVAALKGPWPGAAKAPLDAFRPAGLEGMYVLGGCADVPRAVAAELLKPTGLIAIAERIGAAAAAEAARRDKPAGVRLPGGEVQPAAKGDVREFLVGVRPIQDLPTVPAEDRPLPVLARYDVVVIGGGTGGAPAGIGAARKGAKTLVVEYLHGLGGVSTHGLIGKYYHGYRGGFTAEIDQGVAALGGREGGKSTQIDWKMEYYRREIRKAGGDVWFGCLGCGAFAAGGRVRGAVVATPAGRGVVLADVVIDGTGNSDVAAAAGAPYIHTAGDFLAVQGTGLPPRALGATYTNTDYTFVDETDMVDIWRLFVAARRKYRSAFDLGQLIDTRERRRIRGDVVMTIVDQVNGRTYPDTIGMCKSDFDTHGYTVHPFFVLGHPERRSLTTYIPYRCLIPTGWDGILVIGLGISVHRDAVPVVRMQPDIQNVGYAAGVAAAMAAPSDGMVRDIDLKALQKHLAEIGNIPRQALEFKDSYPMPDAEIARAVASLPKNYAGTAVILAHRDKAAPLLRKAHAEAKDDAARLVYAHALGVCGDAGGVETLIQAVRSHKQWDKGWNFRGMGQYGSSISPLDRYIIALGMAGDRRAVPAILEKVKLLSTASEFSHHRAAALALELIGEKAAAEPLGELLAKPDMTGHAVLEPAPAGDRSRSLREIIVARALFRLGDHKGQARKVLTTYTKDLRGHFARHAHAILQAGKN